MHKELQRYLREKKRVFDRTIKSYFPSAGPNARLNRAIRYSLAGGKRLRPILVFMGSEICHGNWKDAIPTACAIEMIHVYSLIHDDLPAMDNDNFRRGRWTCHRKFGEAEAILAGDALLTRAFEILTSGKNSRISNEQRLKVAQKIARDSGIRGMVGGQEKDIATARTWKNRSKETNKRTLLFIHRHKTAALIRVSLEAGAILADADRQELRALHRYGENIGLAFQIMDDVLDITGDKKKMGKEGSDLKNRKLTYPLIYGIRASQEKARNLVVAAKKHLKIFGEKARMLSHLADYIIERTY